MIMIAHKHYLAFGMTFFSGFIGFSSFHSSDSLALDSFGNSGREAQSFSIIVIEEH